MEAVQESTDGQLVAIDGKTARATLDRRANARQMAKWASLSALRTYRIVKKCRVFDTYILQADNKSKCGANRKPIDKPLSLKNIGNSGVFLMRSPWKTPAV